MPGGTSSGRTVFVLSGTVSSEETSGVSLGRTSSGGTVFVISGTISSEVISCRLSGRISSAGGVGGNVSATRVSLATGVCGV